MKKHTYNEAREVHRLAREIRNHREALKLTQMEVAFRAGMTQSMIARLERGGRGITLNTLARVAHILNKKIGLL